jgi:hypothetical protein
MDESLRAKLRKGDLPGNANGDRTRQRASAEPSLQGLPREQLGDEIGRTRVLSSLVQGDDVGVIQGADGPGLVPEPVQTRRILLDLAGQDLQRHLAADAHVPRPVNLAHSTAAQHAQDLVRPDAAAGGDLPPC